MRALRVLTKCGVQGPSRLLNHAHSLTVARMVSLPRFGSLWAFGPSAHRARASLRACRALGQSPKALCRSIFRERCERPKGARNAAPPKIRGFQRSEGLLPSGSSPSVYQKSILSVLEDRDAPGKTRIRRHVRAAGNPQSSSCANPGAVRAVRAERRNWLTYACPDKGGRQNT